MCGGHADGEKRDEKGNSRCVEHEVVQQGAAATSVTRPRCPYLDPINRQPFGAAHSAVHKINEFINNVSLPYLSDVSIPVNSKLGMFEVFRNGQGLMYPEYYHKCIVHRIQSLVMAISACRSQHHQTPAPPQLANVPSNTALTKINPCLAHSYGCHGRSNVVSYRPNSTTSPRNSCSPMQTTDGCTTMRYICRWIRESTQVPQCSNDSMKSGQVDEAT